MGGRAKAHGGPGRERLLQLVAHDKLEQRGGLQRPGSAYTLLCSLHPGFKL